MRLNRLGLVHTSATLVPIFADLCNSSLPSVVTFNIADDSLIKEVIERNQLTASVCRRVAGHVVAAEAAGADAVLVTCSSIGPAAELAARLVNIPVHRVDQPMADQAVRLGTKIGVAATLPTTLEPTADLIRRRAAAAGKEIALTERLCEGAFDALMSGNAAQHDQAVGDALRSLASAVDVIVLAQASMARVAAQFSDADLKTPILASPELAIKYLADTYE